MGIYYLIKDILYLLSILYLGNEKSCKITAFFFTKQESWYMKTGELVHEEKLKTGELVHENRRTGT